MKKILALIFLIAILIPQFCFAAWQPDLRIKIIDKIQSVSVETSIPSVFQIEDEKIFKFLKAQTLAKIEIKNGKIFVNGENSNSTKIFLRTREKKSLTEMKTIVQNLTYPGGLNIEIVNGSLRIVNVAPIEEYLRGVLPSEMSPSYPIEALKAQAIAARTFALKNRGKHGLDGYDLCNSTHCQVYKDESSYSNSTDKAIAETFGQTLFFGDVIIDAPFHADSGGKTASSKEVWGGDFIYLQSVNDVRFDPWKVESKSDFDSIDHIYKTTSGRVEKITFRQGKNLVTLTGSEIRAAFNLPSTMFDVKCKSKILTFIGYGSGHGVGMSQMGARELANRGKKFDEILKHYFQKIEIRKLY